MSNTEDWAGCPFTVYPPDARWPEAGGLYIFAGVNPKGEWYPLYIGQAESLAERLTTHENWPEAAQQGATHIHAQTVEDPDLRVSLERHLIKLYQPRLNVQGK